jgi:VWFA-related protein
MRIAFVAVPIVALGAFAASSGATSRTDTPSPPVIRISVEMIRLDAVVTDKKGRHVTDLRPEDFEVFQDGQPRRISTLTYVTAGAPTAPGAATPKPAEAASAATSEEEAPHPPRTIVFVVDDLGLGPHSFDRVRRSLKWAVEHLEPTDQVAVVTTARFGGLHPTTDRQANLAEVAALRRTPWTRDQLPLFASSESTFFYLQHGTSRFDGGSIDDWNTRLALQSIAVVKETIKALQPLPGRKALLLISEGFSGLTSLNGSQVHDIYWPLDRLYGDADDVLGAWKRLGDFATRASVVVHAVDPRGLVTAGINAADSVPNANEPGRLADVGLSRRLYLQNSQASLEYLTDETGGLALLDQNDLAGAFSSILADLSGYYLIGYEPGPQTFDDGGFHDFDVKVRRPGLKVRTRKGFYAVTDEEVKAVLP